MIFVTKYPRLFQWKLKSNRKQKWYDSSNSRESFKKWLQNNLPHVKFEWKQGFSTPRSEYHFDVWELKNISEEDIAYLYLVFGSNEVEFRSLYKKLLDKG